MATTPAQAQQDLDEFASSFNGAEPERRDVSDDEAFGLSAGDAGQGEAPEPAVAEAASQGGEAATETPESTPASAEAATEAAEGGAEGGAGDDSAGAAPAMAIVIEPGEGEPGEAPRDEKDVQREKSWEGRLRAREAELAERERALAERESAAGAAADPGEAAEPAAAEAGEQPVTEAIETAVEKVESGELTAEQAMDTLGQDFGEDFVKMLGTLIDARAGEIAGRTADERVSKVAKTVDDVVNSIVSDKKDEHFESLSDAHPDFQEIAGSEAFRSYVDGMTEDDKAKAEQVIAHGSARKIIKLLNDFKASQAKTDEAPESINDAAADDAEGVRSSGLRLPDQPSASEGYEEAWSKF